MVILEIVDQRLAIGLPALGIAERVQLQPGSVAQSERRQKLGAKRDDLDIGGRLGDAEKLHVKLVKLPVAALLRPLVAEHRAVIEDLYRHLLHEAGAQEGPRDARRRFPGAR